MHHTIREHFLSGVLTQEAHTRQQISKPAESADQYRRILKSMIGAML